MSDMPRARQPRGEGKGKLIDPAATAPSAESWMMSLRCHQCEALFSLTGIPAANLVSIADSTVCPACGAVSEPYRLGAPGFARRHLIVKLEKERR
jgi:hypothetical protein